MSPGWGSQLAQGGGGVGVQLEESVEIGDLEDAGQLGAEADDGDATAGRAETSLCRTPNSWPWITSR